MVVAGWSLTNACNLRCKHCYNNSGKITTGELSLDECFKVSDKLKRFGVEAVNFGGGECALSYKFIPLCKYLNKLGIKISYTTNGTTYERIRNHLFLFSDIGVSLDFANEKRHDLFRGKKGVFKEAISTIEKLVASGVNTEIVTCLTRLNSPIKELERMYLLSKKMKVNYWRINRFRQNGRGKENNSSLSLSKEDLKRAYSYIAKHMPRNSNVPEPIFRAAFGGRYSIEGDPSGFSAFRIQANGEVTPSVFLQESGGNIKNIPIKEIMDSGIFRRIREREARGKCKKCPAYYNCRGGDAGASYLAYGHFNGPDPLCFISRENASSNIIRNADEEWNVHERYLCTLYIPIKEEKDGISASSQA